MVALQEKEEWKCSMLECGELSAMQAGVQVMQMLCVDSWDSAEELL